MSSIKKFINLFKIKKYISVDLGSSNILIYDKYEKKILLNEPTIVAKDTKSNKIIAIGSEAQSMIGKTSNNTVLIKPISYGVVNDIDISKYMLNAFIKRVYKFFLKNPIVIVCIPSHISSIEKEAIASSFFSVKKLYFIDESRATILGSGVDLSLPSGRLIVNIGSGTTSIAVFSLDGVISTKTIKIAGNNFDEDIVKYIKKHFNVLISLTTAEKLKKDILHLEKIDNYTQIPIKIRGKSVFTGLPTEILISSDDICDSIKYSIDIIVGAIKEVISKCPPEIAVDILNDGIILSGGSSLLNGLDIYIENKLNISVFVNDKPLEATVIGANTIFNNKKILNMLEFRV